MNGGPGCTSLKGAFEELGQLVFNRESAGAVPKLFRNPLAWTKLAHMVYFESPPGVGYSYCAACAGNVTCRCAANDTSTASDNADAVEALFAHKFPELRGRPFYITGESYAGIYIPMLMRELEERGTVNLQGAAIGNGCWGTEVGTCGGDGARVRAYFYAGKGLFSKRLEAELLAACGPYDSKQPWNQSDAECGGALSRMNAAVGPHNFYNVDDFCPGAELLSFDEWSRATSLEPRADGTIPRMDAALHDRPSCARGEAYDGVSCQARSTDAGDPPLGAIQQWCGVDSAMMSWLDVPAVRTALNVGGPGTKPHEKNNLAYTRAGAADLRFVRVRVRTPLPARTAGRRRARAVRCTSGSPSGIGSCPL